MERPRIIKDKLATTTLLLGLATGGGVAVDTATTLYDYVQMASTQQDVIQDANSELKQIDKHRDDPNGNTRDTRLREVILSRQIQAAGRQQINAADEVTSHMGKDARGALGSIFILKDSLRYLRRKRATIVYRV